MYRNPRISVVLPVYNGSKYLYESMTSVLDQSFKDFELIVCDDKSQDDSLDIIRKFNSDTRLKILYNSKNMGLFYTLNKCIKVSNTNYLKLWSQDDVMKISCLESHYNFHTKYKEIGFSYTSFDNIDDKGNIQINSSIDTTPEIISSTLANQIMFYYGSITGNISNVMINKDALNLVGLFNEDMKVSGDFEMWVRISEKYPIGFINGSHLFLRNHIEQFSQRTGILQFIKENRSIYRVITSRLPAEINSKTIFYTRYYKTVNYMNSMIKSVINLKFKYSWELYCELSKENNPIYMVLFWIFTLSGKFFKPKPIFILYNSQNEK